MQHIWVTCALLTRPLSSQAPNVITGSEAQPLKKPQMTKQVGFLGLDGVRWCLAFLPSAAATVVMCVLMGEPKLQLPVCQWEQVARHASPLAASSVFHVAVCAISWLRPQQAAQTAVGSYLPLEALELASKANSRALPVLALLIAAAAAATLRRSLFFSLQECAEQFWQRCVVE